MAYNYYQTQVPGWGTSQFQFGAPPVPSFQPQPSWRGYDFYNAHAVNPEPGLFDSIMSRIRSGLGLGVSHSDARHWHKQVYSGLVPLTQLLPADIGAAAAYEAYRTWKHNSFLYEPLSADRERQREGLIGMAIAETQRLWHYSQRAHDTYNLRAACEAAAAAATVLADRLFNSMGASVGRASSYASSAADSYAYDDSYRRRSRHNSFSAPTVVRVGGSPLMGTAGLPYASSVTPGAVPMPIAGAAMSAGAPYGAGVPGSYSPYGGQAGLPGSYTYGGASPNPYAAAPSATPYTFNGVPVGYGAGAAPYGAAAPTYTLPNGQPVPPGSTVIITHPHRSRRHSTAGSHKHHRSSSRNRYDDYERERQREKERERERERDRELEREAAERDWERADRERHERDRRRWEQEEQERAYGMDDYGRYGRVGAGMGVPPSSVGYGYGGRY